MPPAPLSLDLKQIIAANFEKIMVDLNALLSIRTTNDPTTVSREAPFGKNVAEGYQYLLKLATRENFVTKTIDGYAIQMDYGKGEKTVAAVCHVDTVNFNEQDWTKPPLGATLHQNAIYGRGIIDDKGPIIMVFWALKILKDAKINFKRKFRLIIGGDEEMDWRCLKYYFKHEPAPDFAFTPDAIFPLIHIEKNILHLEVQSSLEHDKIVTFKSGQARNMIPAEAVATIRAPFDFVNKQFKLFLNQYSLTGEIKELATDLCQLTLKGQACHGMEPNKGLNAITYLAQFLNKLCEEKPLLFLEHSFHNDFFGKAFNFAAIQTNNESELTISPNMLQIDEQHNLNYLIEVRFSNRFTKEQIINAIYQQLGSYQLNTTTIKLVNYQAGIEINLTNPVVQDLIAIYRDVSHDLTSQPVITGGGTFSRLVPNCIAYGALFPWAEETAHQANERMHIDDFKMALEIYCRAIYRLVG